MAKDKAPRPAKVGQISGKAGLLDKITTLIVVLFFCSVLIAHAGG